MKKRKLAIVFVLMAFLVAGCTAALQNAWNSKTPDEQARIIVSGLQKTLNQKFDEAKALVVVNPQYQEMWKKNILPAFDRANKTLRSFSELSFTGALTPAIVYAKYKPDIDALMLYLLKIGMKGGE